MKRLKDCKVYVHDKDYVSSRGKSSSGKISVSETIEYFSDETSEYLIRGMPVSGDTVNDLISALKVATEEIKHLETASNNKPVADQKPEFKPGDIVQIKSGGPGMVVGKTIGDQVIVSYYNNVSGLHERAEFSLVFIEHTPADTEDIAPSCNSCTYSVGCEYFGHGVCKNYSRQKPDITPQ